MHDCPDLTGGGLCRRADGPLTCGKWCPRRAAKLKGLVSDASVQVVEKMGADPVPMGPNYIALMCAPARPGLCWEVEPAE